MNTLQVNDDIEGRIQTGLDIGKMREAMTQLDEGERVVLELGFGMNGGKQHSLDSIAKELGRTKHWAMARYKRGLSQLGKSLGVELNIQMQTLSPGGASQHLQEEVELKSAILENWRTSAPSRQELGELLLKLRDMLAIPGRKGQFSSWLEDNHIPRRTAYNYIADVEPEEPLSDSKEDKLSHFAQFSPEDQQKRFEKLYRTVLKFYDCFAGNRNAQQILADWDALQGKIRLEMVKTLGLA